MKERNVQNVCLMNMCAVMNTHREVVALDKVSGNYLGTTFPGGHIEEGEVFQESIIREVYEETGLRIEKPTLCGVYHWRKNGIHYILFIYKTTNFQGELQSSKEGKVYWISWEELKKKPLATGTNYVMSIIEEDDKKECVMRPDKDTYIGTLY